MLADERKNWPSEPDESGVQDPAAAANKSPLEALIQQAVKTELEKDSQDSKKLKELSKGLEWLKNIIDSELEKRVESRLLSYKLLYAGYFGSKGRKAKYAHNPCAIREAIRFCKDNDLPPPDWTLNYIHGLMMGVENLPGEQDEKRWNTLMKLLDIAAEWDKKAQHGMTQQQIEGYFRRRGVSDEAINLAQSFTSEPGEQKITEGHL
jgi:hypothetical protein